MSSLINGYIGKLNPGDGTEYSLGSTAYAECATAAATTQKEIEMTGFTLMQGATIFVKFINGNTNDSPTLRIKTDTNSYTDIKNIIISNNLINNSLVNLTYDGIQWLADSSNLNSTILENSEPYSFRQTGGSTNVREIDANLEKIDSIIGGSLAWNQLAEPRNATDHGITISFSDGVYTYSGTATGVYAIAGYAGLTGNLVHKDHVYYLYADTSNVDATLDRRIYRSDDSFSTNASPNGIIKISSDALYIQYRLRDLTSGTAYSGSFKIQCFDLTLLFGTEIADYIYNLEQATAGAGVAWFRRYFPNDYYAYNAGTMESVQVSAHKTVGFNQWDEEWELGSYNPNTGAPVTANKSIRSKNINPIPVFPNTTYCFARPVNNGAIFAYWYDAEGNYISRNTGASTAEMMVAESPANARFLRFALGEGYGATYKNDVCVNLSYDGSRNGEYEPYVKHTYPLDDSLTLRGIPKLDENNKLYFDGDVYSADGTVTRRYGIVDLGTRDWTYVTVGSRSQFRASLANVKIVASNVLYNATCTKYQIVPYSSITDGTASMYYTTVNGINILDSAYTDPAAFKAAMSGVYLVYELATPTTETANPYTQIQKCSAYGTEEFIDAGNRDFSMPVGHITEYQNGSSLWIEDPLKIENKDITLNWNATSTIATIGGQDITVKLPTNPNDDIAAGTTGQFWRGDKTWSDTLVGDLTLAPTSAGNISSGRLYIEGANGKKAGFIMSQDRNNLDVGWDWGSESGSGMAFRGANADDHTGSFIFFARNSAATTQLIGEPNGELYWYKYTGSSTPKFIIGAQSSSYNFDVRGTSYLGGNVTVVGNILPSTSNNYSLGSSDYEWVNVYATTFNGALNGNAASASKLGTTNVGTEYKPIYLVNGVATANHAFVPETGGTFTGDVDFNGNVSLNNETTADSLVAGSLLVNGAANFVQSPTAPTPEDSSNDTTIATTEFVKRASANDSEGNAINTTYLKLSGGAMTGNIHRFYSAASTEPMITALSNNRDIFLWEVGHGTTATTTTTQNHYKLKYIGTNAAPNNHLQLIASTGTTDTVALQVSENGNVTLNGTVTLTKEQDALGTSDAKPALIVGGTSTAQHIEIDSNEILSKSNGTTPGILYLQTGTGSVLVGGSGGLTVTSLSASQAIVTDADKKLVSRGIRNNTSTGTLGWVSGITTESNLEFINVNTLAYWDGSYRSTDNDSNLKYSANGEIMGLSTAQTVSGTKTFSAIQKFTNITDAEHSTDTAAAVSISGGVSVAKRVAAKEVKIDDGSTTKGVTMQYDSTLEVLNFVFT